MEQGERESWGGELAALDVSLLELVDHVLNRGVVLTGEAVIAVADVDLIYLGLDLVLSSVETAREAMAKRASAGGPAPA